MPDTLFFSLSIRYHIFNCFLKFYHAKILQITENPKVYSNLDGSTGLKLWPMFSLEKTLVRKEVEAFPLISLVADCGGILGLFLGFNFLMIWEWIMDFILFCVIKILRI